MLRCDHSPAVCVLLVSVYQLLVAGRIHTSRNPKCGVIGAAVKLNDAWGACNLETTRNYRVVGLLLMTNLLW